MINGEKNLEKTDNREMDIVFSRTINAGKRIYYIDVKRNKKDELYLSITESKKVVDDNSGGVRFEKFKIFLYKEDLDKFQNGLKESIDYIKENNYAPATEKDDLKIKIDEKFDLGFDF
jgi:hypothetical protein